MASLDWPVVHHYDATHLDRISLPIGGIGTGSIGLGGRGDLRDFEVGNRPGKGFRPEWAFFAIRAEVEGRAPVALAVEGPVPIEQYEGTFGSPAAHHGLPRFASCEFEAGYPFGRVRLRDDSFPVAVDLVGFNPLLLTDVASSSIPAAVLRHRLSNLADADCTVSVALSMSNFIGANGTADATGDNRNTLRENEAIAGVTLTAPGLAPDAEAGGELTMALLTPPGTSASHRTGWDDRRWGNPILDFWDDLLDDGQLEDRQTTAPRPIASLAGTVTLGPGESADLTFLLTWNFPHRRAWRSEDHGGINVGEYSDAVVGNAYSVAFPDSWQTATELVPRLDELERASVDSVRAVVESDAPREVVEAALFNLSTLRSPTVFQTADGEYYGWEGVGDRTGSCYGTCTHVWGYEFATSLLFAPIAHSFRRTQFARCTDDRGLMSFRIGLPLPSTRGPGTSRPRTGRWPVWCTCIGTGSSRGDDELLRRPVARRAPVARVLLDPRRLGRRPRRRDGGCASTTRWTSSTTAPIRRWGRGTWPRCAPCEEMAESLGEGDFAATCRELCAAGRDWIDAEPLQRRVLPHEVRPRGRPGRHRCRSASRRAWGRRTRPSPTCSSATVAWSTSWSASTRPALVGLG